MKLEDRQSTQGLTLDRAAGEGRTGPSGADSNSCLPGSPSNAKSLFDVSAPTAHTTAVLLSAVVAMEEPLPWWFAHHAVRQEGGFSREEQD